MTITIEIGRELENELARQAAASDMRVDVYAATLLEEAAKIQAASGKPKWSAPSQDVVEAIERLKEFGKTHGLSLGGTALRDLRHEARP